MNLQQIKSWLKDPSDYQTGLKIYNQYKKDTSRDIFFLSGQGRLQRNILYARVQSIYYRLLSSPHLIKNTSTQISKYNVRNTKVRPTPKFTPPKPQTPNLEHQTSNTLVNTMSINLDDLPDHLIDKYKQNKILARKKHELHTTMQNTSNDERASIRAELLEIDDKIASNFEAIDNYIKNPTDKIPDPLNSGSKLERDRRNLMIYIKRAQKNLVDTDISDKKQEKLEAKIKGWQTRLAKINAKLENK